MIDTEASSFIHLCYVLWWLPKQSGIFFVFLDTSSKILNLTIPVELDSSEYIMSDGKKLFSPLYLFWCMDVEIFPVCDRSLEEAKRLVQIWNRNKKKQFIVKFDLKITHIVNYIYKLLWSFSDPISFHSEELEKNLMHNMAILMYLDTLDMNDISIISDDITEVIIENNMDEKW